MDIPELSAHRALVFESIEKKLDTHYYAKRSYTTLRFPRDFGEAIENVLWIQTIREDEKKMRKNEKIL